MAGYVGINTQIRRNNTKSLLLLIAFPTLIFASVFAFIWLALPGSSDFYGGQYSSVSKMSFVSERFLSVLPWAVGGVAVWFMIAYFSHSNMINLSTSSHSLPRKDNKRVYNLVENLCMSQGMPMPKLRIIYDNSLNAFASGIGKKSYTVTLSKGLIERLDDDELEGVIAHELMHIKNKDVRLLIVSIIFVGIFAFLSQMVIRMFIYGGGRRRGKQDGRMMLIALAIALVGYLLTVLFKFALSRKREYMADSGAAEMTKKPQALASALRKISGDPKIEAVSNTEVAQMFIENPIEKKGIGAVIGGLFASHPPIKKRIQILEQF